MSSALDVSGVSKLFGRRHALVDIELSIAPGEFVGLVGLNGAGKTTLFKCLLDLYAINSGSISIFGVPHRQPKARQNLCFFPEKFVCPGFATGQEFLDHSGHLRRQTYSKQTVLEVFRALDLPSTALSLRASAMSKGTAQKLGLAAALLADQGFLIMDEPMSGLDPRARALLKRYLLEKKNRGLTLLFSSHMLADLDELCDRIAILDGGKLLFLGAAPQLMVRESCSNLEDAFLQCVSAE